MWSAEWGIKKFLVERQAIKLKLLSSLIIILALTLKKYFLTQTVHTLSVTLELIRSVLLKGHYTRPMTMIQASFDSRLVHLLDFEFEDVILRG